MPMHSIYVSGYCQLDYFLCSLSNVCVIGKLDEVQEFLEGFAKFISDIKVKTPRGDLQNQDFQKGIKMSTASMNDAINFFVRGQILTFILGSRFTSDALENFFSQVRRKNISPTPLEFQRAIKCLIIVSYLKPSSYSCYEEDDEKSFFLSELAALKELALIHEKEIDELKIDICEFSEKDFAEEASLAHFVGYLLKKTVFGKKMFCVPCQKALTISAEAESAPVHDLIKQKAFTPGALKIPAENVVSFFSICYATFKENRQQMDYDNIFYEKIISELTEFGKTHFAFPPCHLEKIIRRFVFNKIVHWVRVQNDEMKAQKEYQDAVKRAANSSQSMKGYYTK